MVRWARMLSCFQNREALNGQFGPRCNKRSGYRRRKWQFVVQYITRGIFTYSQCVFSCITCLRIKDDSHLQTCLRVWARLVQSLPSTWTFIYQIYSVSLAGGLAADVLRWCSTASASNLGDCFFVAFIWWTYVGANLSFSAQCLFVLNIAHIWVSRSVVRVEHWHVQSLLLFSYFSACIV